MTFSTFAQIQSENLLLAPSGKVRKTPASREVTVKWVEIFSLGRWKVLEMDGGDSGKTV